MSCTKCSVMVEASYLKAHMVLIHGICVPKMKWVGEVGGGLTTYIVSLPKLLQTVNFTVPGCMKIAHIAG